MKKYLIFLLVCMLGYMSAFAIGYAEWGNKKIEVEYRDISIIVNGKKIQTDVEPFIYNGRTFVPVRWVAEALDKEVGWDGDTWTVYINDKEEEKEQEELFLVKRVIDGDTIELENGVRVRYIGINAPEKGQNFYEEATQRNRELVEGKKVRLEYDVQKFDQYGRTLAYVFVGNIFVNLQLVKEGLAVIYTVPPNVKYTDQLYQAEQYAKEHELGMWKKSEEINIKIVYIEYDAPGNDNYNLNGEWVKIKNFGSTAVDMTGYTLKDEANHTFYFPTFTLDPESSVKVYTGCGTNTSTSLYWCSNRAIWNNNGDTAFLYDKDGYLIDTYEYP